VFSTSWKGALARKRAEGDAGASSRGVDAAGAPFQLALREPCVRAPVRRAALVMLQHHGGHLSCRRHEHKALKTRYMSPDGLLGGWWRTLVFENAPHFHQKCLLLFRQFHQLNQCSIPNSRLLLHTYSKRPVLENQGLSRKHVYFCLLLHTFHIGRARVLFDINGLTATGA
jgi:hypothetical protein